MDIQGMVRLSIAAAALALSGCASEGFGIGAPILDSHFGEAVTQARAMQVIHPDGAEVNDEGYSGRSAQRAMELYGGAGKPSGSGSSQAQGGSGSSGSSGSGGADKPSK
jgi:hypothetical protein